MPATTLNERFLFALDDLVSGELVLSRCDFCAQFGISVSYIDEIEEAPGVAIDPELLFLLVDEYGVCAHWLITGEGPMYSFLINVCKISFGVPKRYLCLN